MRADLTKAIQYLRSPLVLFILVNIPFLLVFYDVWNLNTIFYSASYLSVGLNPYSYHNQIPGGLPIQVLGLGTYYAFRSSQSNYLLSGAVLKVLYLALTYLSGLILSRVAKIEGLAYHRKILYAFIFNPFLLFVNNVWVETDVIIIFLYLLGYATLYYGWDRGGDHRYLVLGALCLSLAIFSYYTIVLLVPTLIVYRETLRRKLQILATFAALAALLSIPLVAFNLTSLVSLGGTLQSPETGINPYSVFNLLPPLSAMSFTALDDVVLVTIAVSSILVPVLLREYGVSEPVSLLTAYAMAYLLFVNTLQGDNFVLLIGLLMLALISLKPNTLSYWKILVLQLFILPQLIVVELFNGINHTTGVFYWSYYQFHASPNLYLLLGGENLWHALLILYLISLCLTLSYFLVHRSAAKPPVTETVAPTPPSRTFPRLNRRHSRVLSAMAVAGVLVLAIVLPLAVTLEPSIGKPSGSLSGFDAGQFIPLQYGDDCSGWPQCAYLLSSPGTFQVNGSSSSAYFASSSVPLGLFRNMTDQSFVINYTANVGWGVNPAAQSMDVVSTSSFYAGQGIAVVVTNSSLLTPTATTGPISVLNGTPTPVLLGANEFFGLSGNGVLTYRLNLSALDGRPLVFGVELTAHAETRDLLWDLSGTNVSYDAFLVGDEFYLGYKSGPTSDWQYDVSRFVQPLNRWFLSGFEVSTTGNALLAFVDGRTLSEPYSSRPSSLATINVGKNDSSNASDYQYSVSGLVTNLYALSANNSHYRQVSYVWSSQTGSLETFPSVGPVSVAIARSEAKTLITVDQTSIPVSPFHDLWVGKLSDSPSSVDVSFGQVEISSSSSGPNLELVVLDFAVIIPAVIAVWCVYPLLVRELSWHRANH